MKITVEREANDSWLKISESIQYESDYQMKMIAYNNPAKMLPMKIKKTDEETIFLYDISDTISLQQYYRQQALNQEEMLWIISEILHVLNEMRRYLLEPDRLVLNPACIFKKENELLFCFLPIYKKSFRKSFHTLTEYFVKELDYSDENAIQTGCRLHKYTMEDNYKLENILKRVEREVEENNVNRVLTTQIPPVPEENEESDQDFQAFQEEKRFSFKFWKRKKKKLSKWGEWENL